MDVVEQQSDGLYKSRWGFHVCSKETFRKLRTVKKCYYQALKTWAAQYRWQNKQPQNRHGDCPKSPYIAIFTDYVFKDPSWRMENRWTNLEMQMMEKLIRGWWNDVKPHEFEMRTIFLGITVESFAQRKKAIEELYDKVIEAGFEPTRR